MWGTGGGQDDDGGDMDRHGGAVGYVRFSDRAGQFGCGGGRGRRGSGSGAMPVHCRDAVPLDGSNGNYAPLRAGRWAVQTVGAGTPASLS